MAPWSVAAIVFAAATGIDTVSLASTCLTFAEGGVYFTEAEVAGAEAIVAVAETSVSGEEAEFATNLASD